MDTSRNGIWIVALSVMGLLLVAGFIGTAGQSDAAADVTNPTIQIFTEDSGSFSALAYTEDQLPLSVNPSKYVRHGDFWYNIDASSGSNGTYLTYGDFASEMSFAEMKTVLTAKYGLGFTVVQLSMLVNNDCHIQYTLTKDTTSLVKDADAGPSVEGYDVQSMKFVDIVKVGSSEFAPAESIGTYTLSTEVNGVPLESVNAVNGIQTVTVTGTVKDASERPVSGAIVYYSKSDNVEAHTSTDSSGIYRITINKGDLVKVTSVALSHYTFIFDPITTGNITTDAALPVIHSQERTVLVRVTDQNGTVPVEGVRVTGEWFIEVHHADVDNYTLDRITSGITSGVTGEDGTTYIICRDPSADNYALLVYAQNQTGGFSFDLDGDLPSPSAIPYDFSRRGETGSPLSAFGNDFANLTDFSAVTELKAEQTCITLTVKGQTSGLEGGAPIPKISVVTQWRYQVHETSGYIYPAAPTADFVNVTAGTAFPVSASDADGKITVAYTLPTWDADPKLSAYLYIYQTGSSPVFTFDVPDLPAGGTDPLTDMVAPHAGATLLASTAVADCEILSSDVAYTVSGTITGTVPPGTDNIVVAYSLIKNVESLYSDKAAEDQSSTPATFRYTVKAGLYSRIELGVIDGYKFTTSAQPEPASAVVQNMPTAAGNQAFTADCQAVTFTPVARGTPAVLETYTVDGLSAGVEVSLKCTISGTEVTFEKTSAGSSVSFAVMGWSGYVIQSVTVTSEDMYVPEFSGTSVTLVSMTTVSVVCFSENGATEPALNNVVKEATIKMIVDGKTYTGTTSASGVAEFNVPGTYAREYRYTFNSQDYAVTATDIASGPYAGMSAINLTDLVESEMAVTIHLTERHVAYSSLYNTEPANATILSTQTVERTTGTAVKFTAPDLVGFKFGGWYLGAECLSSETVFTMDIEDSLDGQILSAVYSPLPEPAEEKGVDPMVLMIGLVAIMIAIMCFAYVLLNRRY